MKKVKVLLCAGLAVALLGSSVGQLVAASPQSTNVAVIQQSEQPGGHVIMDSWATEYVERATSLGLVPPTFTNLTSPISRAEFTDLAVRLYENMTGREIIGRMNFNDTSDLNVQKMGYLGVVSGIGNGYFNPYGQITREQAAVILVRLFNTMLVCLDTNLPIMSDMPHLSSVFADYEQISPWAFNGVASAYVFGIMRDTGNNNFSPRGNFTIQQSVVAILRVFDILISDELANDTCNMPSIPTGISLNISSYTASGLSFHFENLTDEEFIYGAGFELYTFVNNAWEPVAPITDDLWAFPGVAHFVSPNSLTEERAVNWTWMFGELPDGYYRFKKELLFVHQQSDTVRFILESDFTLQ